MQTEREFRCPTCGKTHVAGIGECITGAGAVERVGKLLKQIGGHRAYVLCDEHTYTAAESVCHILQTENIPYSLCVISCAGGIPEPNEKSVGTAVMHFDRRCDAVVGVGSGVINDIGKLVSHIASVPYIIVGTAPSMDGYASATSSVIRDGLKVSLPARCADVIIGDTEILCTAPGRMLIAGLGDMLAKYISIAEWRISALITGEDYCPHIAGTVRSALQKCVQNAAGLLARKPDAVQAVFEALVISGVAMNYAGTSRPASGVEHYFSHIWDMRGLEFGTPTDLHGIQCAIGTRYAAQIYDKLREYTPDRERALAYTGSFHYGDYAAGLRAFLGRGAEALIAGEAREQKYSTEKHRARLEIILNRWEDIRAIIEEEIPTEAQICRILDGIRAPKDAAGIGQEPRLLPQTLAATRDIRDKYILSRLLWDLGIAENTALSV